MARWRYTGREMLEPALAEIGERVPDGFAAVRVLGEGGFGRVIMAQTSAGRRVALKTASPRTRGAVSSLLREIMALTALGGRASPAVIATGTWSDGGRWLAMEVVHGTAWPGRQTIEDGSIRTDVVLDRFGDLLAALGTVHAAGWVHGDLKPDNVFVGDDGRITFIDFGLSHRIGSIEQHLQGEVIGTADSMSPEQCTPGAPVDSRSDLYAVGVLLYRSLSGAPPFEGSAEEIREAHRSRRPASLATCGVPGEIDELILRCLAKDPAQRPASAQQLADQLKVARDWGSVFQVRPRARRPIADATGTYRQQVALLWFRSGSPVVGLHEAIRDSGGQLVQARATEYIAAYTRSASDNPIRSALVAGNVLLGRGLVDRVLIDLGEATVRRKPDGAERISSGIFRGEGRYPDAGMPRGLLATADAARTLPELDHRSIAIEPGLYLLGQGSLLDSTEIAERVCPLFGRAPEVARLQQQAARTRDRLPGLATVIGQRGFGKSRLALELVDLWAPEGGATKLVPFHAPDPMHGGRGAALRGLLTAVLPLPSVAPDDVTGLLKQQLGVRLDAEVELGIRFAMQWIDDDHPAIRKLRAAPGALRSLLGRALGEILLQRAQVRPLHLLIDDGQFLDDAALDALEYATRAEVRAPLWVCVFARPGFVDARPAWGAHAGTYERFELGPLAASEASDIIRHLLQHAINLSQPVVDFLVERTRGIPLVIVELLRALKREGLLRKAERGRGWIVDTEALHARSDVPLVQWLLERELDALSPAQRGHAGLASSLGPSFSIARLAAVVREMERTLAPLPTDLDPAVGVARLRRAGLLVERIPGRYEFRHDLLREAAYASISLEVLRACHGAAYRVFERDEGLGDDERLSQLAFHAAGAGFHREAIELQLTLAGRAVDRHDYLVAQEAFKRAIEYLDPDDPRCVAAIHGLGLTRFRLGEHEHGLHDLGRARDMAERFGQRDTEFDLLLDMAMVYDWTEDYPTSRELVERARTFVGVTENAQCHARLLLGLGRSRFRLGDAEGAAPLLAQAARVAANVGEAAYETHVIALLLAATVAGLSGREDEGRPMFDELLELCNAHSDQLHLATTYLNRCVLWLRGNDIEALVDNLRQAIRVSRSSGYPLIEARALFNLGEISYMVGRYDEALKNTYHAIDLATQSQGEAQRVVVSRLLLARIHLLAGHPQRALREVEQIQKVQALRRAEGAVDTEFMPSDQALFRMVQLGLASTSVLDWDDLAQSTAAVAMQQELVEILELAGWNTWKQGKLDDAARFLERATAAAERHPTLLKGRIAARRAELTARMTRISAR